MKKLLLSASFLLLSLAIFAQTPPNKNLGIVNKTTATWCGPCGDWGWTLFEDVITDNQAKAICMGTYGDAGSDLQNQTAIDFYKDFCPSAGWPAFNAIGINRTAYAAGGGIYPSTTQTNVKATIDSFVATPVIASTGYTYTMSGNNITINTTTKFWTAANGDYYVNVYFVEDGVMNIQNGQAGVVAHHDVLRGGVSGSWGQSIVNGAVTANQTFSKTFNGTMDPSWDKWRTQVVTMIWKKVGSDYQFVNANNVSNNPLGITSIEEAGNVRLYPNPANNFAILGIDIDQANTNVSYFITDFSGKIVASKNVGNVGYGVYHEQINTENLSNGTYIVALTVGKNIYTGKLSVSH